jgi:hypothetical protein
VVPTVVVLVLGVLIGMAATEHTSRSFLATFGVFWLVVVAAAIWSFQHASRWQLILTEDAIEVRDAFPLKPRRLRREEISGFRVGGGARSGGRWLMLVPTSAALERVTFYPGSLDVDATLRDWVIGFPYLDTESPSQPPESPRHLTADEWNAVTSLSGQMRRQ